MSPRQIDRAPSRIYGARIKIFVAAFFVCGTAIFAAEPGPKPDVVVAGDGTGDVKTVKEAVDRVPKNNAKRFVILIKRGVYMEQIEIPSSKPHVSFLGENAEETKLTFSVSSGASDSASACTAYIGGDDFHARNITFENSLRRRAQAMAVIANADRLVFRSCRFQSRQDTVYVKRGRHYFENCYIEGSKDFVCGAAAAVFENCTLHSTHDGYIAAPMRFSATESSGLVFVRCKLTGSGIDHGVFLGRPWGPYGRAVYLATEMGAHIRPEGWNNWSKAANEKTAYFAECDSKGPGAKRAERAKWSRQLGADEARQFEPENFLKGNDGWNPKQPDARD
jgi:pectinesterase